jgi:hypothetical protein
MPKDTATSTATAARNPQLRDLAVRSLDEPETPEVAAVPDAMAGESVR